MSATRQASRPLMRSGSMGPLPDIAHSLSVCGLRFRWNAAQSVGTTDRFSTRRETKCVERSALMVWGSDLSMGLSMNAMESKLTERIGVWK